MDASNEPVFFLDGVGRQDCRYLLNLILLYLSFFLIFVDKINRRFV